MKFSLLLYDQKQNKYKFFVKETGSDEEEGTEDKTNNNAENNVGPSVSTDEIDNVKRNKRNLKLQKKSRSRTSEKDAGKLDNANKTDEYEQDSSDEEVRY